MENQEDITGELRRLLTDLVAIPTAYPPGDTTEMATHLVSFFEALSFNVSTHEYEKGMVNVVARMGSESPQLALNIHVDTVGPGDLELWQHPPHTATLKDGLIYGLGAANCKGSGAIHLYLAKKIAERGGPGKGEVVFTFVTDEESLGPNGMSMLRDKGVIKPDMLLLGAPTDNQLIVSERGVLWVEITTGGQPAHAGEPQQGDNAVMRMMRIVTHLERELNSRLQNREAEGMHSTMSVGKIKGGHNTNVVPSHCTIEIDRRLLPNEKVEDAFREIVEIVKECGEPEKWVQLKKIRGTNGFLGNLNGPLETALCDAVEECTGSKAGYTTAIGVSDGRYFSGDGIEIVNFGPGIGSEGHASNESISLDSLVESAHITINAFERLIGFKDK